MPRRLPLGLTAFLVRRPSGWYLLIPLATVLSLLGITEPPAPPHQSP